MGSQSPTSRRTGYGFVAVQFLLIAAVVFDPTDAVFDSRDVGRNVGTILTIIGWVVMVGAVLQIRRAISVLPIANERTTLMTNGFFRWSRHPIYVGVMCWVIGTAIQRPTIVTMTCAALLIAVLWRKTIFEERDLAKRFPGYADYQHSTRRFL
jgi:protein-S-isoprenylcysteine O-methyltransferase Ste14